ncbi:hypothetical protein [Rhodococcus opacus]|uniref:hypothetical protein n=1 Tax=Rhodococcus opacus TaxID=37919 RepID=UPI0029CA305D|nr:hypothetical protein [Rhodococcus opacus]
MSVGDGVGLRFLDTISVRESHHLVRIRHKKVDGAFFGNTVTNGPSGLLSVAGVQVVDTGAGWTTLDYVHDAKSQAMAQGAE